MGSCHAEIFDAAYFDTADIEQSQPTATPCTLPIATAATSLDCSSTTLRFASYDTNGWTAGRTTTQVKLL
jgi:hypothetical protein